MKNIKIAAISAALAGVIALSSVAVILGPVTAISREPDAAAQTDPRQRPRLGRAPK
jgi:hypothetical protein